MPAGIATNQYNPNKEILQLAEKLCYIINNKYMPPKIFYDVGGMKIFS